MVDIWLAYLFFIPSFVVVEGIYLLRNPRTFRAPAVFVYLGFVGLSIIFALNESWAVLVPFILCGGFGGYYVVKMWCHEGHRLKERGGRFRRRAL